MLELAGVYDGKLKISLAYVKADVGEPIIMIRALFQGSSFDILRYIQQDMIDS